MKRYIAYGYVLLLCLFAACGTSSDRNEPFSSPLPPTGEEPIGTASLKSPRFTSKEGDFQFTLFSKRDIYPANEEPEIYAELKYIGEKDRIAIIHSDSLIAFSLHELTRGVKLDMLIREIAAMDILEKNKPILKKFDFKKEFMHALDETSERFFAEIQKHGLPPGDYIIYSHALFSVKDDKEYHLKGEIRFQIKK